MQEIGTKAGIGAIAAALCLLSFPGGLLPAQETEAEARFAAESLRFRTALHYDPLLDAPLESLFKLYFDSERTGELIALYRNHISQYPDDAGAKTVLIRLLRRVDRTGADELIASSVPQHPDYPPLQYLLSRLFEERGDARAAEALMKAIDLETHVERRNAWLEELLDLSEGEAERALAKAHFAKLLGAEGIDATTLFSIARLAQRHRFWDESIAALTRARAASPDPEAAVEIDLMLATALAQVNKPEEASKLLDALLARLTADHWRRREILTLRLGVVATEAGRKAYLESLSKALEAKPDSEAAVLDLAEALIASERRTEAAGILVAAAVRLPKSRLVESRTLEILEAAGDAGKLAGFLADRLEVEPDRLDLRFRYVKAQYAMRRDAAAEQDFRTVVAGLPPEEVSERILELQRYLRSIERVDAAVGYLEQYVRNHPARLDVARELAEIRISEKEEASIGTLVRGLQPAEAETENVLDFAEFLLANGLVHPARLLVEAKLAVEPRQFDLGIQLIEILGRGGDATAARDRIATFREMTDTAPRYAQWLQASLSAHRSLETLPGFLESELNRYDFAEGDWPEEKVEKFILLCEAGKRELFASRIAEGIRRQLAQSGLEPALKLRLRKVLVAVLETDPASAPEVEEQLKSLATEDAAHRSDHDLRRALVYHGSERHDLAREVLSAVDFAEVTSAPVLRDAVEVLIEYGMLAGADGALGAVTKIEPGDLLSWERRLSVLAAMGEESALRTLIRSMKAGEKGLSLREQSVRSLEDQLDASYWRSISALIEAGDVASCLPLLASAEQERTSLRSGLWTEWTRVRVLSRLGREAEAKEAFARLQERSKSGSLKAVSFPDGLELSLSGVLRAWNVSDVEKAEEPVSAEFLLDNPVLRWAFELPDGVELVRQGTSGSRVLLLDDLDWVHCLDSETGKLLWRGHFGLRGPRDPLPRSGVFDAPGPPPLLARQLGGDPLAAKEAPPFLVTSDRFFLIRGRDCVAHAVADGSILWSTPLPAVQESKPIRGGSAAPGILLALAEGKIVAFDPQSGGLAAMEVASGKLLWQFTIPRSTGTREGSLASLNCGLRLSGNLGFAYGSEAFVFDTTTGEPVWWFRESDTSRFPVLLRPPREEEEGDKGGIPPANAAIDPVELFNRREVADVDFDSARFFKSPSALVGPAVFWAESRFRRSEPAFGDLAGGFLWLMQERTVRRISSDLPIASRELPADGTFVGRTGDHLWFLTEEGLLHADFRRGKTTRVLLGEFGAPEALHATMIGTQIVVRGNASVAIANALTGEWIGRSALPAPLVDYLAAMLPDADGGRGGRSWTGLIRRGGSGQTLRCLPSEDLVAGGRCFATFGNRIVVALEASPAPGTAVPPAPTPQ